MNWRRKARIWRESQLFVAAPARWMLERVQASMLAPAAVVTRVVPNGVDLEVFRPREQAPVRKELGIDANALVVVYSAHGATQNPFKDYATLREALGRVAARIRERPLTLVVLGEARAEERVGSAEVRFAGALDEKPAVARWLQAADVYVHAARAEMHPLSVLEALACGTPVVASSVGGIPEQVHSLETSDPSRASGLLVPPKDAEALARALHRLLDDPPLRARLGDNARRDAALRFSLAEQVSAYLALYEEALAERGVKRSGSRARRKDRANG